MAKQTIDQFFSDLSEEEIDTNSPTVYFALDGVSYEIDLTDDEASALRDALAPYIQAGRKVAGSRSSRRSGGAAASRPAPKEVRAWAEAQGIDVPSRGRIPAAILDQYLAANPS
ncbi:MAG: Lsr2 family protein [Aeromicrobium sp.]|uniref:histone-like nucleoid-structuring protein Lsr2 n=1 Tax=Aeromicrobium sp. TaxID=1871063 RepID=UPI0039E4E0EF